MKHFRPKVKKNNNNVQDQNYHWITIDSLTKKTHAHQMLIAFKLNLGPDWLQHV